MFSDTMSLIFYLSSYSVSGFMLWAAKRNRQRIFILIALAIPIAIATFRFCGTDIGTYIRGYIAYNSRSWDFVFHHDNGFFELGFRIISKLLSYLRNARIYLGVIAAITLLPVYRVSLRMKKETIFIVMILYYLLYFTTSFNVMRQYLAVGVVAYGYRYVFERDIKKFTVCILLATMFHTSAIVSIFMYFLWTKNNKLVSWGLLVFFLACILATTLSLAEILETVSEMDIESSSIQRYTSYVEVYDSKNRDFYLSLLTSFIAIIYYKELAKVDVRNKYFVLMMIIGTILGASGFISPFVKRIAAYFAISEIWLLPDIPRTYNNRQSIVMANFLVLLYAFLTFIIVFYILRQSYMIPYKWILPDWASELQIISD